MRKELIQFYRENKVAVWVAIVLILLAIVGHIQSTTPEMR
jgi:hypothetical protein